ncbi:ABC transporter ATP-binding protein [Corynebacterium sp. sy017]|nr:MULTISPECIES: ABC transporter ATP-binding protein [unclassified Corynebacterium]MBP3088391.1 ABC transporter ATP-binding protein [Corynebacterium sp. sy017]TSD92083.1 ABC transporter ATP-binding protein [Corynebacterium sp. SY003]
MRQVRSVPGARLKALCAIILLCVGSGCTVMMPRLLGQVVDVVRDGSGNLGLLAGLMAAIALVGAISQGSGFYLLAVICERVIANLRSTMVGTALGLPLHNVEDAGTGDLVSRSTDDVAEVSAAISETLPVLTTSTFTIAATAVALTSLDPRLLAVALVTLPVYWWAARRYLKVAPGRYAQERAWMATRARRVLESIHGRATVRAFRMEQEVHARIGEASEAVVTQGMRARMSMMVLSLWITVAEFILVAGVLSVGFLLVRAGAVSVGTVTAAALMMIRIRGPIMMLMRVLDTIQSGYASLARIVGVVVDPPQPVPDYGAPAARGLIQLRDVEFSYPGGVAGGAEPGDGADLSDGAEPGGVADDGAELGADPSDAEPTGGAAGGQAAVHGVSFEIQPGQTVALVGASGAGKSTIAALLMGLRVPSGGQVLLDGVPVSALSDAERATRVAMVNQEAHTFSGSLREDVAIACENATDQQVWEALDAVGAGDWARGLECGLDTEVGAMGVRVDPVRGQQIALARVLLMDPAVVVMDEATAEAGSALAGELELAAQRVLEGRSALVVAHRLDQAVQSDRIIVMDSGQIIESGTHRQLLSAKGEYARLWEAWSRGR